jgi:ATP-binding cassette subfamily B protein
VAFTSIGVDEQGSVQRSGQDVIVQGEEGDKLYLIVRGVVDVLVLNQTGREQYVETLEDGDHCAEAALLKRVSFSSRAA